MNLENIDANSPLLDQEDIFYRSHDDLLLYAKGYGPEDAPGRPLICLPGLTRNGRDFEDIAISLSTHPTHPRRVYCLDYRGRGRSEWDKNWWNYSAYVELLDVIAFLTLKGLNNAAFIGSSRGGIIAMMLGAMRPSAIGCLILNDIGPIIETAGLARIMGYAGKIPIPRDWDEARRLVRDMNKRQFTAIDDVGWDVLTHQLFNQVNGRPAASYDPNIGKALSETDISKPVPQMWEYFEALRSVPVMVSRGENSDILSAATVQEMQKRYPRLISAVIRNEGHTPLLLDRFSQRLVADFLAEADANWQKPEPLPPAIHKEVYEV